MKFNKGRKFLPIFLSILILLSIFTNPIYCSGDGSGGGGGSSIHLDLVGSTPSSGSSIDTNPSIKLLFNKNVAHDAVKGINSSSIKLVSNNGQTIPIDVIFADINLEPEKRREIIVKPKQTLSEGTLYTVQVSPSLKAKNGMTLDKNASISFTTKGVAKKVEPEPQQSKPNVSQSNPSPIKPQAKQEDSNMNVVSIDNEPVDNESKEINDKNNSTDDYAQDEVSDKLLKEEKSKDSNESDKKDEASGRTEKIKDLDTKNSSNNKSDFNKLFLIPIAIIVIAIIFAIKKTKLTRKL